LTNYSLFHYCMMFITLSAQTTCLKYKMNAYVLHNRMISEGSCDTEVWSNDAENLALFYLLKLLFLLYL